MDYQVEIKPIPEDAPRQKIDLDSNIVQLMHAFRISKHPEEYSVPDVDRQAYDHKLNLFYMFTPSAPY